MECEDRMWCAENGEKPTKVNKFGSMMTAYGLEKIKGKDCNRYVSKKEFTIL